MNVVLIGYRGSGKTSIGKKLASALWLDFLDIDAEICRRFEGRTVAQIWDEFGEPAFREVEEKVVREACQRDRQVIALGGGTLMQPDARGAIEQASDTRRIYLACQPQELSRRIEADTASAGSRPNLTRLAGGVEEIRAMLEQREPVYQAVADHTLDVTHLSIDAASQYLLRHYL